MRTLQQLLILASAILLAACDPPPVAEPTLTLAPTAAATPVPSADPLYAATGGGDPRSPGYWALWNSCAPDNRSETARANGGRAAGWLLMDDLLADPGVSLGGTAVESCALGLALLKGENSQGQPQGADAAYALASQLLAARLNLLAGSAACPAAERAELEADALLAGLGFDGQGSYLGPPRAGVEVEAARELEDVLARYNGGRLCVP